MKTTNTPQETTLEAALRGERPVYLKCKPNLIKTQRLNHLGLMPQGSRDKALQRRSVTKLIAPYNEKPITLHKE